MAQFKAYRNLRPSSARVPFLLDVQSDLLPLRTRLVMPMVLESEFGARLSRLNPVMTVAGKRVVLSAADLAAVPLRELGGDVADLSAHRHEISSALDFLLQGY